MNRDNKTRRIKKLVQKGILIDRENSLGIMKITKGRKGDKKKIKIRMSKINKGKG